MNYFDSAVANGILSVHYQIGGDCCRNFGGRGKCVNFMCKLNLFMLTNSSMKGDQLAKEMNATINKLIFPLILKQASNPLPLTFSMMHLLHRLYGVL